MIFAVLVDAETYAIAAQFAVDRLAAVHQFRRQLARSRFNHRSTLLLPLNRLKATQALVEENVLTFDYLKMLRIVTIASRLWTRENVVTSS